MAGPGKRPQKRIPKKTEARADIYSVTHKLKQQQRPRPKPVKAADVQKVVNALQVYGVEKERAKQIAAQLHNPKTFSQALETKEFRMVLHEADNFRKFWKMLESMPEGKRRVLRIHNGTILKLLDERGVDRARAKVIVHKMETVEGFKQALASLEIKDMLWERELFKAIEARYKGKK